MLDSSRRQTGDTEPSSNPRAKNENQHQSSYIHVPTSCILLYAEEERMEAARVGKASRRVDSGML